MTTVNEARQRLRPPLIFGSETQIEAHEFWVAVLLAAEHLEGCPECLKDESLTVDELLRLVADGQYVGCNCDYQETISKKVWLEAVHSRIRRRA